MKSISAPSKFPLRAAALSYLSLFTSVGTLFCCALPSLLVLFGLGAVVASLLSYAPWLVTLSRHKHWVFIVAGALISGNFAYIYVLAPKLQIRSGACNPNEGRPCRIAGRASRAVLWCSAALYLAGFFSAYVLGPILWRFD